MRYIEHFRKHARPELWWVAAHALYTGQRQGDVLAMMRSHVHAGSRQHAITVQSLDMVEHHAEQVNQRKLARAAILKWEQAGP
jgi:hypothetical protein